MFEFFKKDTKKQYIEDKAELKAMVTTLKELEAPLYVFNRTVELRKRINIYESLKK